MLAGIKADVLGERDPSGTTTFYLLQAIDRHIASEADALDQYERLARQSADPIVGLVMRIILDDEKRHHQLLGRIQATLRDTLNWTHSPQSLPRSTHTRGGASDADLAAVARMLSDEEKAGAQALRRLAYRERSTDGALEAILLEMMAMDSDKHARLLEFVSCRLEARVRANVS
jgi:hypothetical protein